mgnify:CR=1 FL=1
MPGNWPIRKGVYNGRVSIPPTPHRRAHLTAILLALLVTFLWSSSWVLIKIGLRSDLPAITFAGLRYTLAFVCLLPFVLANPNHRGAVRSMSTRAWRELAILGVVFYSLTQGAQFLGLAFLPAATLTFLLNFPPVFTALSSVGMAKEPASPVQWGGILLSSAGALVYFLPLAGPNVQAVGWVAALVGVLANAASSILGRRANAHSGLPPILITTVSMGIGGVLLLLAGVLTQGFGVLTLRQWLIIAWLALVNTAAAFTLWNYSLKTLTAVESGVINSLMLPQIAILAWVFLGEALTLRQIAGITIVAAGTLVVQMGRFLPSVVRRV